MTHHIYTTIYRDDLAVLFAMIYITHIHNTILSCYSMKDVGGSDTIFKL